MNAPPNRPLAADLSAGLSALERTDARALRGAIRAGRHHAHTVGLAPGRVQGNLVVLPQALAGDFMRFCQRNPKPCPLLAVTEPGDPIARELGEDVDLRTDVPRGYYLDLTV
jgi:uncharacterized protein YcsI (UPF0317 family)